MCMRILFLLALALPLVVSCGRKAGEALPPLSIGHLAQNRLLEGDRAQAAVTDMHSMSVAPERSWVASYGGAGGVTIYASRFATPTQAETALGQMRAAMAEGKSGFGTSKPETAARQAGYRTEGLSQSHFFFVRGSWLIWIEGRPTDFAPAVKAIRWGPA
jgi:hypothetical protein